MSFESEEMPMGSNVFDPRNEGPMKPASNMNVTELRSLVKQVEISSAKGVAVMSLSALRQARDASPKEWDALMKSSSGEFMLALWDYLKEVEKTNQ